METRLRVAAAAGKDNHVLLAPVAGVAGHDDGMTVHSRKGFSRESFLRLLEPSP